MNNCRQGELTLNSLQSLLPRHFNSFCPFWQPQLNGCKRHDRLLGSWLLCSVIPEALRGQFWCSLKTLNCRFCKQLHQKSSRYFDFVIFIPFLDACLSKCVRWWVIAHLYKKRPSPRLTRQAVALLTKVAIVGRCMHWAIQPIPIHCYLYIHRQPGARRRYLLS